MPTAVTELHAQNETKQPCAECTLKDGAMSQIDEVELHNNHLEILYKDPRHSCIGLRLTKDSNNPARDFKIYTEKAIGSNNITDTAIFPPDQW